MLEQCKSKTAHKQTEPESFFGMVLTKITVGKLLVMLNKVGDATGAQEMCEMWKNQYYNLYNKLESNKSMQDFYDQVNSSISSQPRVITVRDVSAAVNQQKKEIKVQAQMVGLYIYGSTNVYCL